jgi:D-ribose pyranose/furanose isomerase RbsD
MGHGDTLIVCDAGFPIPEEAWRIDLALVQDVPDLRTVLAVVAEEFIAEKVRIAQELKENNPPLYRNLTELFDERNFELIPRAQMLSEAPREAKAIVRTGAFDPFGNVALISGVDAKIWFSKEGTVVPAYYRSRVEDADG